MKLNFTMGCIEYDKLTSIMWIWYIMKLDVYSNEKCINLEFKKI